MKTLTPIPLGGASDHLTMHADGERCVLAVADIDAQSFMDLMRGDRAEALVMDLHTGRHVCIVRGGPHSTSATCELMGYADLDGDRLDAYRAQHAPEYSAG